ncbi:uncharacterized protein M421DRAFT_425432, partial [Didymella exigua CBS 183.55]
MLRRGIVNHILLYRESFNPPHFGHKTLLTNTFFRSSFENMIPAFVIPMVSSELEV